MAVGLRAQGFSGRQRHMGGIEDGFLPKSATIWKSSISQPVAAMIMLHPRPNPDTGCHRSPHIPSLPTPPPTFPESYSHYSELFVHLLPDCPLSGSRSSPPQSSSITTIPKSPPSPTTPQIMRLGIGADISFSLVLLLTFVILMS